MKVLVADDDAPVRSMVSKLVTRSGHEIASHAVGHFEAMALEAGAAGG